MPAEIIICENHKQACLRAAELIAGALAQKPGLTATLAAGDTPLPCYEELISRAGQGLLRLDTARYIGLDEWLGLGPGDAGSCIATMNRHFYRPASIPPERIFCFDGRAKDPKAELERMRAVAAAHPLDLALVGVGVEGHIGFNEPGAATTGDYDFVPLSASTQEVGRKYFEGRATPATGVTLTLAALQKAGRVIVLATGESKRAVAAKILGGDSSFPAGCFLQHPGAVYIFDKPAAEA